MSRRVFAPFFLVSGLCPGTPNWGLCPLEACPGRGLCPVAAISGERAAGSGTGRSPAASAAPEASLRRLSAIR